MIGATYRWIRNWIRRWTGKIDDAADNVMTGSVDGIKQTYKQAAQAKSSAFNGLLESVGTVQGIINGKKTTRTNKLGALEKARNSLEGALAAADLAEANGGKTTVDGKVYTLAQLTELGTTFAARVEALEGEIKKLTSEIDSSEEQIRGLKKQLEKMKDEIAALPSEEAEHVAEFISDEAMVSAFKQINGILTAHEEDPLAKLRAARQKKHGEATVAADMAGVLTDNKEDTFASFGEKTEGNTKFEELRRARKAEKEGKTGGATKVTEAPAAGPGDEPKF